jgi:hypothetical protein
MKRYEEVLKIKGKQGRHRTGEGNKGHAGPLLSSPSLFCGFNCS